MKTNSKLGKKMVVGVTLLMMAGLLSLATAPADQPLTKDDVTLLLLGSPPSKIISIVEQRGVDFQMSPDLAKKFHDLGANHDLIDALQKAGNKAAGAKVSAPAPAPAPAPSPAAAPAPAPAAAPSYSEPVLHTRQSPASSATPAASAPSAPAPSPAAQPDTSDSPRPSLRGKPNAPDAPEPPAAEAPAPGSTPAPAPAPTPAAVPSSSEPVLHTRQSPASTATPAASAPAPQPASPQVASSSEPTLHQPAKQEAPPATPATSSGQGLKDPDAQEIQHIIQQFAAKEKIFREARNNYTYHQINKVEEFGANNEIMGTYEQEWDILYDDHGKRIEKVTYAPVSTLKRLGITKEDIEGFRNIQPFVLTTDELPEYEIRYLGHVKVDEITAYVFRIQPKEIQKGRLYFKGQVYVDDRDLQIVKSQGKQVPENKKENGENLFPEFSTWREQVDGKFWFPTFTMGDDTLYFASGSIHMKEVVRYTDYKQFKSTGRILSVESIDKPKDQTTPAAAPPKN